MREYDGDIHFICLEAETLSLPQSKTSARFRLNVVCWCIFEACKQSQIKG